MKQASSYKPTKHKGIFENTTTGRFQARMQIGNKHFKETFDTLYEARVWRASFDGEVSAVVKKENTSTLREVWEVMQAKHFPTLESSTKEIWLRRYELLSSLEHLRMEEITSDEIDSWVTERVKYFKSDEYVNGPRGQAKRCNLDNELNLFCNHFQLVQKIKRTSRPRQSIFLTRSIALITSWDSSELNLLRINLSLLKRPCSFFLA